MKRIIASIMAIILCFSLTACGKKEKPADKKPEKETNQQVQTEEVEQTAPAPVDSTDMLTVVSDNNKKISLGDTIEDVEKALGKPDSKKKYSLHYPGVTVYIDNTVNMITVTGEGFTGFGKATIGKSIHEFKEEFSKDEYFAEEQTNIGFFRMTFALDENGEVIKNPDDINAVSAPFLYVITSNDYATEGTITHIQLKDNQNKQ